jgi:hypothetical protein
MHNNKAAYSPSLYVDEHGEEDVGLRRGRPFPMNVSKLLKLYGVLMEYREKYPKYALLLTA